MLNLNACFRLFLRCSFLNFALFFDTPGNVVRDNQTVMQRESLRYQPAMSYGLDNFVNNGVSAPVLFIF